MKKDDKKPIDPLHVDYNSFDKIKLDTKKLGK